MSIHRIAFHSCCGKEITQQSEEHKRLHDSVNKDEGNCLVGCALRVRKGLWDRWAFWERQGVDPLGLPSPTKSCGYFLLAPAVQEFCADAASEEGQLEPKRAGG